MIIDCISDLHGNYPELEGGDLLIIAGDLTARHTIRELDRFNEWLHKQKYEKKIVIAGNHDALLERGVYDPFDIYTHNQDSILIDPSADYLCDSGTEFEGLKIWGSPWTKWFARVNPKCAAFMLKTEDALFEKWSLIPTETDIVITHSPMYGVLDSVGDEESVGSTSLRAHVLGRIKPKLHVCGHIHEWGGRMIDFTTTRCVNASIIDENYDNVNKPVRVIL